MIDDESLRARSTAPRTDPLAVIISGHLGADTVDLGTAIARPIVLSKRTSEAFPLSIHFDQGFSAPFSLSLFPILSSFPPLSRARLLSLSILVPLPRRTVALSKTAHSLRAMY